MKLARLSITLMSICLVAVLTSLQATYNEMETKASPYFSKAKWNLHGKRSWYFESKNRILKMRWDSDKNLITYSRKFPYLKRGIETYYRNKRIRYSAQSLSQESEPKTNYDWAAFGLHLGYHGSGTVKSSLCYTPRKTDIGGALRCGQESWYNEDASIDTIVKHKLECTWGCESFSLDDFQAMEDNGPFLVPEGVINVRSKPTTASKILITLNTNDVVYKISQQKEKSKVGKWTGRWTFIEFKGRKGWVLDTFIKSITWAERDALQKK